MHTFLLVGLPDSDDNFFAHHLGISIATSMVSWTRIAGQSPAVEIAIAAVFRVGQKAHDSQGSHERKKLGWLTSPGWPILELIVLEHNQQFILVSWQAIAKN
jgi:hypothetical protein